MGINSADTNRPCRNTCTCWCVFAWKCCLREAELARRCFPGKPYRVLACMAPSRDFQCCIQSTARACFSTFLCLKYRYCNCAEQKHLPNGGSIYISLAFVIQDVGVHFSMLREVVNLNQRQTRDRKKESKAKIENLKKSPHFQFHFQS